jgi:hypothetical protein
MKSKWRLKNNGGIKMNVKILRAKKTLAQKKLDDAMNACGPEFDKMWEIMNNAKNDFLFSYKNFKNQKISEHEFLQNSTKFAQNLDSEEKMYMRFRKILGPLTTDFEKICKVIHDLEAKK